MIPHIVWQNLSSAARDSPARFRPAIEASVDQPRLRLSSLVPRRSSGFWIRRKSEPEVIGILFSKAVHDEDMREVLDLFSARIREGNLPPAVEEVARQAVARGLIRQCPSSDCRETCHTANIGSSWPIAAIQRVSRKRGRLARSPEKGDDSILERRMGRAEDPGGERGLTSKDPGVDSRSRRGILAENDRSSSVAFRGKVLDSLSSLDDPELAPIVLKAFPAMPPS